MITDEQAKLLRQKRMDGKTLAAAAAASGMSERTARKWQSGSLPSQSVAPRAWRTRKDVFEDVWQTEIEPLLVADEDARLQATTIFAALRLQHPDRFGDGQLRTLQRRIGHWRALHGPPKDVIFPQVHPPGREAAFDFTHTGDLAVTITGVAFVHLLFTFRLSFSGWTWVELAFGETYEALLGGLQGALWALGGVPEVWRHDNLSAATHELRHSGGRTLTRRFADVLAHYDARSTRINPGQAHENGIAERGNDLVKRALDQALLLRGSRDFGDVAAYMSFVREVVGRCLGDPGRIAEERRHLRPLPAAKMPDYTIHHPTVRRWSTIRVGRRAYSVPSRLIGRQLEVHQYSDRLEVFYGGRRIETMPRLQGDAEWRIDYRHVIWSLVRKPGAFARYRYREELFPSIAFRQTYDRLRQWRGERADVEYVRILHLAASTLESRVEAILTAHLQSEIPFDYAAIRTAAAPEQHVVPAIAIARPDLTVYDRMLGGAL